MFLVKRHGILHEIAFRDIKEGDLVFLNGEPSGDVVECGTDCHECGDSAYAGQWLFHDVSGNDIWEEDVRESMQQYGPLQVWCRVGVSLRLTKEDADILFGPDETASRKCLEQLIHNQPLIPFGDSYIPASCISEFNQKYGTSYPADSDIGTT